MYDEAGVEAVLAADLAEIATVAFDLRELFASLCALRCCQC